MARHPRTVFAILTDAIHRFEGTVNQYTGDAPLFGAPIAHEDHAQRACYAALHLRDQLQSFAHELRRTQGLAFETRIELLSFDKNEHKTPAFLSINPMGQGADDRTSRRGRH